MTGVAQLLTAAGESAPVQRVRNYYRTASPRPRNFLTAMGRAEDLSLPLALAEEVPLESGSEATGSL